LSSYELVVHARPARRALIVLATAVLAAACDQAEKATPPPVVAARPTTPSASPADRPTTLIEDIRQARETARTLAEAVYKAEEPLWRQAVGVSKPSQVAKRISVEKTFFEKELRKVADRRGMKYEEVAAAASALADRQ